jgi:hypothetical protein
MALMSNLADDRASQFLISSDKSLSYDEARSRLERASLYLTGMDSVAERWAQAAFLSIAACGTRMFRGGVFVDPRLGHDLRVGQRRRMSVLSALQEAGCKIEAPPLHAIHLHVGEVCLERAPDLYCWTEGWAAIVSPKPPEKTAVAGNELSGALAGAMAVAEVFRKTVLQDLLACRRTQTFDLWPGAPSAAIEFIPSRLWLIGLGNLGQATLFILGLLPFENPTAVSLLLQDNDISGPENLAVQVLTTYAWVGQKKARAAAAWAESRGFSTQISERRFAVGDEPRGNEPRIALVGIDNLEGRRAVASSTFDLVVDAGLGATGPEAFDVRIHSFPGGRNASAAWPEPEAAPIADLPPAYQALVDQGRLDQCGAMIVAGQSVGVPCTALAAAAMQLAQLCRCIGSGSYCDLIDVSIRNPTKSVSHVFANPDGRRLPFVRALAS